MPTPVQMPKQGNSVEECLIVEWAVSEGSAVKEGETLCTIETDKATFEVPSPATGTLLKTFFPAGELVPVLVNIAVIGEQGEDADAFAPTGSRGEADADDSPEPETAAPASIPAPALSAPVTPAATADAQAVAAGAAAGTSGTGVGVSPRARNLAARLGVDPAQVSGTGPGARVVSADIQNAVDAGLALTRSASHAASQGLVAGAATGLGGRARVQDMRAPMPGAGSVAQAQAMSAQPPTEVPFKGIRKLIGERMMQSLTSHAQLTLNSSADASAILALRKQIKRNAEAMDLPNITLNDMISLVVVKTLMRFPELNGIFAPGSGKLLQYHQVHLGMAVDTERGLMVPVVRNAHAMTLPQLSVAIADLAAQCRKGSLNPDLLQGGTFTITNLGTMGIESFTPVLNTPQVAILGVCAINQVPVPGPNGCLSWQPRMGLSLTIDHQVVDGAPAARFLQAVADGIGGFALMLV